MERPPHCYKRYSIGVSCLVIGDGRNGGFLTRRVGPEVLEITFTFCFSDTANDHKNLDTTK